MTLLSLTDVSKRFGGVQALAGLNLNVEPARITGLIGPNGAGKTTVVNLITGLMKLSSGRVFLREHDITLDSPVDIARLGVSRTYQSIRLFNESTVIENVTIGFHRREQTGLMTNMFGFPAAFRERQLLRDQGMVLLADFGMEDLASRLAGQLSYGHQRRLEIIRALASAPDLLLLDEPVAGMNDAEANELGAILRKISEMGVGILLIEHNMRFVMSICSEVNVLHTGRIISSGTPNEVTRDPAVISAYLGEE